jgi:hypothetical protein
MKNQRVIFFIFIMIVTIIFFGCEGVAELFHGPRPLPEYTVIFELNGGTGTPPVSQKIQSGSGITLPDGSNILKTGYSFIGWNTDPSGTGDDYTTNASYTVNSDITFYVKWDIGGPVKVPGLTFAAKLSWLQTNVESDGDYTIEVTNATINTSELIYEGKDNITITMKGIGVMQTIQLVNIADDPLFIVGSGVTLALADNITLRGIFNNETALVHVGHGGTLIMYAGSIITNNLNTRENSAGGGVTVDGEFIMHGGTISANSADAAGGGVFIDEDGVFTMNDGLITGNKSYYGGGVAAGGTFNMNGGIISGNTAEDSGGGVVVGDYEDLHYAIFTMNDGTISGNTAGYKGGGVATAANFYMEGGQILNNTADHAGGGVSINSNDHALFTMANGIISKNTSDFGGGVDVSRPFVMNGGIISQNTAVECGGGVEINSLKNAIFTLKNGIIQSNTADYGGGVRISGWLGDDGDDEEREPGIFNMEGGTISKNTAYEGGGICVDENVVFTMKNGTISENTADNGGGIIVEGTLTMDGGIISNNTAKDIGGGIFLVGTYKITGNKTPEYLDSKFIMNNGTISGNNAKDGGGVAITGTAEFTMNNGTISGNQAIGEIVGIDIDGGDGGGVFVTGLFTMKGGSISGNTASFGGGIYIDFWEAGCIRTFNMSGGTISRNSTRGGRGGGIFTTYGIINKTGGIITGYGNDKTNGNVVRNVTGTQVIDNNGHAICVTVWTGKEWINIKRKENTAGPTANLFYNWNNGFPTWDGGWDF